MGKEKQREQLYMRVPISKKESKLIAALTERAKSLIHRKLARQLKEALAVIQDYQDLME